MGLLFGSVINLELSLIGRRPVFQPALQPLIDSRPVCLRCLIGWTPFRGRNLAQPLPLDRSQERPE